MRIAVRFQREAKIAPGNWIVRHEFRRRLEFLQRVRLIAASPQRYSQALARRPEPRLDRDGLPELSRGLFRLPLLPERDAIVVARFGILGTSGKTLAKLRNGVSGLRVLQISPAE